MKRVSASRNTQLPIYGLPLATQPKVSGKTPTRPATIIWYFSRLQLDGFKPSSF
jgi:hypothetical protein